MNRIFLSVVLVVFLAGCSSKNADQTASETMLEDMPATSAPAMAGMDVPETSADFINQAIKNIESGQVPEAIQALNQAIIVNPQDVRAYLILGETYMRIHSYDNAAGVFQQAVKLDSNDGNIYYLLGLCYGFLGKTDDARGALEKSIEVFQAEKNEEGFKRSVTTLQQMMAAQRQSATELQENIPTPSAEENSK